VKAIAMATGSPGSWSNQFFFFAFLIVDSLSIQFNSSHSAILLQLFIIIISISPTEFHRCHYLKFSLNSFDFIG